MKKVFLDTNVLVDFLAKRNDFYKDAAIIMTLGKRKEIKLYVASMSFATSSYLMSKYYHNDTVAIKNAIRNVINHCNITVVDRVTIEESTESQFDDFEDAMQYSCAMHCNADYIVTRNLKDFTESSIPCYEPAPFLRAITEV
jgi:predicted nucleic-acid-binding protein